MPWRRVEHYGQELTNNHQVLVTFGNNLTEGGGVVRNITIANRASVRRRVTIHFPPPSTAQSESNCIFEEYAPPNCTIIIDGPWHGGSGSYVSAISDNANSDVGVRVTAAEEYLG